MFPRGSAAQEFERRKDEQLRRGESDGRAEEGVIDEIAHELIDGKGIGIVLRDVEQRPAPGYALAAE